MNNKLVMPLTAAALVIGAAITIASQSAAQTGTTPPPTATPQPPAAQADPAKGGHVGANGVREELLTGDNATRATAAALAVVPGGTIQRVETDAEGAAYEAHMLRPDGTPVTVKMDSGFNVIGTEAGLK